MKWKIACVLIALVACAVASHVSPVGGPQPTSNPDGSQTYTYSVTPETDATGAMEQIRDFHLFWINPLNGKKAKVQGTPGGGPSGWSSDKPGGSANWAAGKSGPGATLPAGGTGPNPFTITVAKDDKFKDALMQWQTTRDGDKTPEPPGGGIDNGPDHDRKDQPDDAIHGPICYANVTSPESTGKGTMMAIVMDTSERNAPYQVFAVSEAPGASVPDPLVNWNGFHQWCVQHPANNTLVFTGLTGNTDDHGNSNVPTVTVPNDPTLVGTKFYLLVVVDSPGAAGPDKITTDTLEVTITE